MTSRTEDRRAARSAPCGTSDGTCASESVRLARTIRWATVASGTRYARAISSVVRPPSSRRVRATRASVERTVWQEMNMRRSKSSPTSSSSAPSRSGTALSRASSSRPSASCLTSILLRRRRRSIARRLAVAMSQAPGFSGMPDSGHRSRATARASWARSSASPTSRTTRARPAMSRADSILQTASMARCASAAVTAADHTIFNPPLQYAADSSRSALLLAGLRRSPLLLFREARAEALLGLAHLGRERGTEVLRLEHLADLDLRLGAREGIRAALHPLDGLFPGLGLDEPEARDELLRLRERPVHDRALGPRELDADALRARLEALPGQQHAGLGQLFVVLAHLLEELGVREGARFRLLRGLDQDHESHVVSP